MKYLKILWHSLIMIKKKWREYKYLFVTMILSFSFLLGFLVYSDTMLFNTYKDVYSKNESIITISNPNIKKKNVVNTKLAGEDGTVYYEYEYQGAMSTISDFLNYEIYYVPDRMQMFCWDDTEEIKVHGKDSKIRLEENEVYVCKSLYKYLKKEEQGIKYIDIPIEYSDSEYEVRRYYVKDWFEMNNDEITYNFQTNQIEGRASILVPQSSLQGKKIDAENTVEIIYTNNVCEVLSVLSTFGITYNAPCEWKQIADQSRQVQVGVKMLVVIVLYVLLGINIYSSFANTLNRRKYEIGIRKSMGATNKDIVVQFFCESMCIILMTILVSVACIYWCSLIYKLLMFFFMGERVVLQIGKFSIIIFAISVIFLSAYFSLVFAIQANRTKIILYLKGM